MTPSLRRSARKLQKLRRDPTLFFYDFFRRRLERFDPAPTPPRCERQYRLEPKDFSASGGAVSITQAAAVAALERLKRLRPDVPIVVCWWE